eukprot:CAMPEP_0177654830 /NCGR_PEP_ID=MMETSP0447-20121125/14574_1 /TAXON_ID=0 /ORGANISM="Stygamoeba regulata, Strain BSH-02190019" /LENGTH=60 /DNA_ID=CAMNT_0019158571 /DNA_START=299 /DNA_END=478 /DNA_ORIENTATION=-
MFCSRSVYVGEHPEDPQDPLPLQGVPQPPAAQDHPVQDWTCFPLRSGKASLRYEAEGFRW